MTYVDQTEFIEPEIEIKSDLESKFLFKIIKIKFYIFVQIKSGNFIMITLRHGAKFKGFEPRLKFEKRLEYGWFQAGTQLKPFLANLRRGSNLLNSNSKSKILR